MTSPIRSKGNGSRCYVKENGSLVIQASAISVRDTARSRKKETDNIGYYFNKINKKPETVNTLVSHSPATTSTPIDAIGFYMETSLHYAVYRPIITELQAMGHTCSLLVSDKISKSFLDD